MTYPGGGQDGWGDQSGGGQQGDYGSGGFPQQSYGGSYGGLGVFSGGDEPPPEQGGKKLWLAIGAVVLVLLAGGGLTTFLVLRAGEGKQVTGSTTAPETTAEATAEAEPATTATSATECKPRRAGWTCVNTRLSFSYDVPKGWRAVDDKIQVPAVPGLTLSAITSYGDYKCENKPYNKGTNGAALVEKGDISQLAATIAKAVGTQYYESAPRHDVAVGQPRQVKIQFTDSEGKQVDVEGVQVDATVTTSGNKCLASKGMLKVLVLVGSKKFHVLVANGDLEGGSGGTSPPLPTEAEIQRMIDSVTPLN